MGLNKNQEPKEAAEWPHFFFNIKRRDLRAAEHSEEQENSGENGEGRGGVDYWAEGIAPGGVSHFLLY